MKKAIFDMIQQEYYDSKEWAKKENIKWSDNMQGVHTVQMCWKTIKPVMDHKAGSFVEKKEYAQKIWRDMVKQSFAVHCPP